MPKPKMSLKQYAGAAGAATKNQPRPADDEIDIERIVIHPQVRTQFDLQKLNELAASITSMGLIHPIGLHEREDGLYDLIWGERRVRAAKIAGLKKLGAEIKRGLSPVQIRQLQVAENTESDGLTVSDIVIGVAKDVKDYGAEEAQAIWNRSDGWISKRAQVAEYHADVRKLLLDGICGDLEVLQSLHQLRKLDEGEYAFFEKRLLAGLTVGREEVRNKVANVKEWQRKQKTLAKVATPKAELRKQEEESAPIDASALPDPHQASAPAAQAENQAAVATPKQSASAISSAPPKSGAEQKEQRQRAALEKHFQDLLVDVYDAGDANKRFVGKLQVDLEKLSCDMNQTDWVLWSGLLTLLLPMLEALGPERSMRYMKRLQVELKGKTPAEAWAELHPAIDGSEEPGCLRQEVAVMPPGWRF